MGKKVEAIPFKRIYQASGNQSEFYVSERVLFTRTVTIHNRDVVRIHTTQKWVPTGDGGYWESTTESIELERED